MERLITAFSKLLGVGYIQVFSLFVLLSSYPFAAILHVIIRKDIGGRVLRQIYVISVSTLILYWAFGKNFYVPIIFVVISYFVSNSIPFEKMASYTIIYCFAVLSMFQVYRVISFNKADIFTIPGLTMLLIQRVTSYACYVEQKHKNITSKTENNDPQPIHIPYNTILDYLSYCFFFPTLLSTPPNDYEHFNLALRGHYVTKYMKENGHVPSVWIHTLKPLLMCIGANLLFVVISSNLKPSFFGEFQPSGVLSMIKYALCLHLFVFGCRCMFYGAWFLSESQCNLCFMGFGGEKDGAEDWSYYKNINVLKVEFAENTKIQFDNWNILTSKWLRKIVYDRVKKHRVTYTFMLSAFWHGLFPHYYHAFLYGAILTYIGRMGHKRLSPYIQKYPWRTIYHFSKIVIANFLVSYHMFLHLTLDWRLSYILWKNMYFIGHMSIFGLVFMFIPDSTASK